MVRWSGQYFDHTPFAVLSLIRSDTCSLSKRSASSLTVAVRRSASRLPAGSSPPLAAAMMVIARVRACSQVSTVLGPRLIRRERRPARYWTMYPLRPLGRTRTPKPGRLSSQMKCSAAWISAASITRLVSLGMRRGPVRMLALLRGIDRARPWKHCGSKRAKVAASVCAKHRGDRAPVSQLTH